MDLDLKDRVVVVTGGAAGIGKACVEVFAKESAAVVIADVNSSAGEELESMLRRKGAEVHFRAADVASAEQVDALFDQVRSTYGRLDVAVVNAAVYNNAEIDELSIEDWNRVLDINLKGAFLTARSAIRIMREHGRGAIVMVSSLAGQTGGVHAGLDYAASKGGVIALTKALMKRALPYGIRVNCVNPGVIDTAMTRAFPPEVREQIAEQHPLHRWGTPREVANTVVFLASSVASFISGAQIDVNGGIHLS
jgi:3-oxoacyl-[acyl-carrier protein] reductase